MADQVCDNLTVNRKSNLLGNVGIGTSNPKELVQIGDKIAFHDGGWKGLAFNGYYDSDTWKRLENGYISTLLWDTDEGVFRFNTGPKDDKDKLISLSERLTILNNGNVGIGASNPRELMQIGNQISFHNGGWKGLAFNGYYDSDTWKRLENGYISTLLWDTNEGVFRFNTGPKDDKDKPVSLSERLTILNNGNVGIGASNPGVKLEVNGDIKVTGDVILTNADCAEDFDIIGAESIEPGTVMVIDNDGALRASEKAYDKRVAGVISGAGDYHPGITLDRQKERENRLPLALTGKVYCRVDAEYSPIEVGDLLTTSPTIGHAMKVNDHVKSLGAIIGKALRSMEAGCGLIPILVALQ